ncbi:MAG: DUF429 domain-containing protein [Candidatus Aenigmatarchaeota archaeon]|nr:MAG: DUF429 domain-containing protein [Candidatus Aenigmarchaeota archaeon]
MLFVGIDLAWSPKNGSGLAVMRSDGTLQASAVLYSNEEVVEYVHAQVQQKNALVAIDAPLVVPNEEGRRVAEAIVGNLFRKYNAGAHPSNRKRLGQWGGRPRGEVITELLGKKGFVHDPFLRQHEESRKVFEVYPHPSMVVLFNLETVIPYKAKPKRSYESRWNAFVQYQKHMQSLGKANPPAVLGDIVTKDVRAMKGNALKSYEDALDAIFCAYIAYYYWSLPEKCAVLGTMKDGYILTPIFDRMRGALKPKGVQTKLTL